MAEPAAQFHALVDLARAPQLLPLVDALTRTGAAQCLFEGALPEPLRRASPHIVAMARAPDLIERWLAEGRGQSWGVFLETLLPMHLARRHVRRFLQVMLPDGSGPVLMRLWDPRVLRVMLAQLDGALAGALLDRLACWVEEEDGTIGRVDATGRAAATWDGLARVRRG